MAITPAVVLTLAGHDPTGGAGIQADMESISALGGYAASAITALTVQDTQNVRSLHPVAPDLFRQQVEVVLNDLPVAAIKIGLIGSAEIASTLVDTLSAHPNIPVVLDPVLAAGGGLEMSSRNLLHQIRHKLLPLCTLITPNSEEARRLAEDESLEACAEKLLAEGCRGVLITGTHEAEEQVTNRLYQKGESVLSHSWPRLPGSYHGSGCTLASAIAVGLAQGMSLVDSVARAQKFTWESLSRGFKLGEGQQLPNRLQMLIGQ
ncbi:MAG: bifunctional hydroxymethylpyrimidine kinase/phosphomethylpyrimidine kinase [Gammaproteobacteria bacterium]|nr:bifunctional hydroxymethylpyrimidine kinase/phosphomethylpyrimidine kinase [Gammaproteobacteria bacterium]